MYSKKKKKKKAYLPTLIFLVMLPQPDTFFFWPYKKLWLQVLQLERYK